MCHHNRILNIVNIITHSYTAYYIILLTPLSLIEINYKNRTTVTNMTLTPTLIIVYFDNSMTKSNNQCSTFRINTNSFNVERHGDHIKTYIHV